MQLKAEDKLILAGATLLYLAPQQTGAALANVGAEAGAAGIKTAAGVVEGAAEQSYQIGYDLGRQAQIKQAQVIGDIQRETKLILNPFMKSYHELEGRLNTGGQQEYQTYEEAFPGYDIAAPSPIAVFNTPQLWERSRLGWNVSELGKMWALR